MRNWLPLASAMVLAWVGEASGGTIKIGDVVGAHYVNYGSPYDVELYDSATTHDASTLVKKLANDGAGLMTLASSSSPAFGTAFRHAADGNVASFCVDIREYIYPSDTAFEVTTLANVPNVEGATSPPMGAYKAEAIERLWTHVFGDGFDPIADQYSSTKSRGFQMALWEIIYEPFNGSTGALTAANLAAAEWDLSSGFFNVTKKDNVSTAGTAEWQAAQYLKDLQQSGMTYEPANLLALTAPAPNLPRGYQDQVVQMPLEFRGTPEPTSTAAIAGVAVAGFFVARRRRRKTE